MQPDEREMLKEVHQAMEQIRADLYAPRPSDGTTLVQRLSRQSDGIEAMQKGVRAAYWVGGVIAAFVLAWASFKTAVIDLLGAAPK